MKLVIRSCLIVFLSVAAGLAQAQSFETVKTKTLEDEKFVFPADLNASALNIVMLAISEEQDNGTWQGEALAEWYGKLDAAGVLNDDVKAWHFSVLKVPFFVKGLIRGGLADSYQDRLPLDQSAPLYVKDAGKFATSAGIVMDDQPNIVLVTPDGQLHETFKGEATAENLALVMGAVSGYTKPAN